MGMTRRYPALKEKYAALHSMNTTASYSGMPGAHNAARTVENIAVRELPTNEQREFEAVRRAVEATEKYKNGMDRLRVIKLIYWDNTHTVRGAALAVPVAYITAKGWHREFLRLVGAFYGYLD
jgi:hypothetical protein